MVDGEKKKKRKASRSSVSAPRFGSTCGRHHPRVAARLIDDPRFQALALIELIIE